MVKILTIFASLFLSNSQRLIYNIEGGFFFIGTLILYNYLPIINKPSDGLTNFSIYFIGQPPYLTYFLIYAFNPTITGFPSIIAVVVWLPWLEAMIRVLPLADGVGVCISTVIINSFPLISTFILFLLSAGGRQLFHCFSVTTFHMLC